MSWQNIDIWVFSQHNDWNESLYDENFSCELLDSSKDDHENEDCLVSILFVALQWVERSNV